MTKAEVMDLTTVCQSFPRVTSPQIPRDNFLDAIDTIFEGEIELIIVEGPEGIGKTTLLAQFAKRHPDHTLSLFVKSTSRWAYDPGILRFDLCNQLQWVLHKEELAALEHADDAFLRTHLTALQRRARRNRETFNFVVDGLDGIPEADSQIRGLILDMLPLGLSGFRFLLAGDSKQLSADIPQGIPFKPFLMSGLILDETAKYLGDLNIDQRSLEEIHQISGGIPGHLASVRRILQSDIDVRLEEIPDKLPDLVKLFEIEWRKIKSDDKRQMKLLAILAHDRKRHRIDDLARMLGVETAVIQELLQDWRFVNVDPQSCEVSLVSEAFRRFVANQLQHLRKEVNDLLISDLSGAPDSETSLSYLPVYLQQAGRLEDLLDYLSPDHFAKMLELSQSLSPVREKASMGVNTALELRRDGDLMRFSLQRSAMTELDGAEIWRSEIEARMALNDYDSALALAQSTILREDRLHLLAVIARIKREQGLSPEPELMEQIRQLCDQIDLAALGERSVEIASDLIHSNFDLAIGLVEKAAGAGIDDENALDWAFAKLSIATLVARREQPQPTDTIERIRARIKDPKVRRFFATASLLVGKYSAAEAIAQAEKLESASDRLLLLRQWAMDNREQDDAAEVVEFALKLAIKTTEYAPNARALREIATPLPFIQDERKARKLVGSFDSQKGTVEPLGPTEDNIRLQLLLAQAENKYDLEAARNRLIDVYLSISDLDDLAIKTACMARLVASLADMDPQMTLESEHQLHTLAEEDLKFSVEQLLDGTAKHYHATRGIIRALAKVRPGMALELATALNTEARRDLALLELVESAIQIPVAKLDLSFMGEVIDQFADSDLRDEALLKVIERLAMETEHLASSVAGALPFVNRIRDIQDVSERCRACCLAYNLLVKHDADKYSGLASHLLHQLDAAWQAIDVGWQRIDIGFRITDSLAVCSLEKGRIYLDLTDELRDEILLDTHIAAWTYIACLRLAIRAYSGLLAKDLATEEDIESLAELINGVPSSGERAGLWAELALRCYANEQLSDCKRIVAEHVRLLLQNIPEDIRYRMQVIIKTAPALYCAHKVTALELISELPSPQRDEAYAEICEFILRKKPFSDPYEVVEGQGYDVTFEEIVDICELLDQMDHDAAIYHFVKCISDSVVRRRGYRLSRQQKSDIANRLERVINSKLPNPRYIKHDGYKIAAQAQVARIRRSGSQVWIDLIESARIITNLADRALVLGMVAISMPTKETTRRKQVLDEAKELVEQIPTTLDKIERYEELASMVLDMDRAMSRECFRLAMKSAVESESPELYSVQRRIIDNAYRLDPDLAASLASLADDDPARESVRANLKRRIQILGLKREMVDQLTSGVDSASPSGSDYSEAAWLRLGSLNAGRVATVPLDQMRNVVQTAASLPLSQSYTMLAWAIENAVVRFARTEQARTCLRPIYYATLLGVKLAARMTTRSSVQLERAKRRAVQPLERVSVLIRPGDRERAIQFLKGWFASEVQDYLKICDPYFGLNDLEVLQILCSVNPTCKVQILTSKKHQDNEGIPAPWGETYRTHWRVRISDQDPPETDIVIAGTESGGELPIHDRWWLTLGGGIRIGTSFNALGLSKTSEISILSQDEAEMCEKEVDQYLQRAKREHDGERVLYDLIML